MVLPRLVLATAVVAAAATAVHVGTATPPSAPLPAGLAVSARPAPKSVPELYELHCAQCHGEKGDGNGVTELERPARSFVEGGYIYGNTIAAVTRTLHRGIPGSAMPSFADSLTEHERSQLARHVLSLGPEGTAPSSAACLVEPAERAQVLDGPLMVPGLAASAPVGDVGLHPSRLVMFPGGPSIQFARGSWDVVALRAQGPVFRDDWRRGGRSITARGEVLWQPASQDADDPGALVVRGEGTPLAKQLRRTELMGRSVRQQFIVTGAEGEARVEEQVAVVAAGDGALILRDLQLSGDESVTFQGFLGDSGMFNPPGSGGGPLVATDGAGFTVVDTLNVDATSLRRRVVLYHPQTERMSPSEARSIVRTFQNAGR